MIPAMGYVDFMRANAKWLAAGVILTFSSSYGQTFFISIFAGEIRAEFGLSHGAWGGIYTLGTSLSAATMIWAGGLTDRFRSRVLGPVFLCLLSAACVFMALNTAAWALILVIFCLRFTGQGMTSHIAVVSMARWFSAARGKALTVAGFGFPLGQAILPLVFVALMTLIDWRSLWLIAAALPLLAIPFLIWLLRVERSPRNPELAEHSKGVMDRHWSRADMLKDWNFWLVLPAVLGLPTFGTALFFQQVHFVETKGWELVDFVALIPVFTGVTILANVLGGSLVDRLGAFRMLPLFQLPFAVTFLIFASGQSLISAAAAFVFFGLTQGMATPVIGSFWAEFYGTRHLGAIKSIGAAVMVFGTAIGPGLTGYLIDFGIDFVDQMYAIAAYIVLSSMLAALAMRRARRLTLAAQINVIRP